MNKIRKFFSKIYIFIVAFISLFGIMIFFIASSGMTDKLGSHLHILPSYTGGVVAQDIYDTAGDDNGSGNLVYPSNSQFAPGALDLVHYTVHNPVASAKWQQNAEYWELDFEFKNGPANVRNIMVYIDLDNLESAGGTQPLFDAAENVEFDSEHPWDFAVWVCEGQGKVYGCTGDFICGTEYYELEGGRTLKIRIPLQNTDLQNVYASDKTYHYVFVGGYSQFDRGGFMPLEKRRSVSHGGTKSVKDYNALIPKIYDVLGENDQLGTWDAQDFTKAKVVPVEIKMDPFMSATSVKKTSGRGGAENDEAFIEKVIQEYSKTKPLENEMFDDLEGSKKELSAKIKQNPADYVSMAYYGSCLALEGGQSSVLQAVALVNEAFENLDKAADLARDKPGEIDVLMNRASVCYSVPNDVFGKAETGAQDFMRVIELSSPEEIYQKAYCYVMASKCYQILGRTTDSVLALQEAKKLIEYKQ